MLQIKGKKYWMSVKEVAKAEGTRKKSNELKAKYAAQDADANSNINALNNTIAELDALESSDQVYNLITNSSEVIETKEVL